VTNDPPKIEKRVPIPERIVAPGYPFDQMEVGDSFSVPIKQLNSARASMHYEHRKNDGRRFISRTNSKAARFWRVK
jgi:hypothetical protein